MFNNINVSLYVHMTVLQWHAEVQEHELTQHHGGGLKACQQPEGIGALHMNLHGHCAGLNTEHTGQYAAPALYTWYQKPTMECERLPPAKGCGFC